MRSMFCVCNVVLLLCLSKVKSLQYVMGYFEAGVTLNVYTHANYDRAAEQMAKIINFAETETVGRLEKSD